MNKIEETISQAVKPLRDDWTLQKELSQELRLHLEESAESLKDEELALVHFGDPEEVGRELFSANFRKIRLRGKLKLVMRIAVVPLLLLAFLLGLNSNMLSGIDRYLPYMVTPNQEKNLWPAFAVTRIGRLWKSDKKLTEEQQLFFADTDRGAEKFAMRSKLFRGAPGNPVFRAVYLNAVQGYRTTDQQEPLLRELIALEPDNAVYSYLLANNLFNSAAEYKANADDEWLEVKDREKLDVAAAEFLRATKLPRCTTYFLEQLAYINAVYTGQDFDSVTQRTYATAMIDLPQLAIYRSLGRTTQAYADLLISEGKPEEAERILEAWRPFTRHITEESQTVIGILVADSVMNWYERKLPVLYDAMNKTEKGLDTAKEIARVRAPLNDFKERRSKKTGHDRIEQKGGLLSNFNILFNNSITDEDMRIDRGISYALIDGLSLGAFTLLMTAAFLALSIFWCSAYFYLDERGHFLYLKWREYGKIFLLGVLLPLGVYLLWTHAGIWNGRDGSLASGWGFLVCQGIVLLIGLPVIFNTVLHHFLRKRYRTITGDRKAALPGMTYLTSLIPCLLCFLLFTTGTLRLVNSLELDHYLKQDKAFLVGEGFSALEDRWAETFRNQLLENFGDNHEANR